MKIVIILFVILSFVSAVWQYTRTKNTKKLLIVLISFGFVISTAIAGNLTRSILPIYYAHWILVLAAWFGVIYYIAKDRYYWWIIASPLLSITLFVILEYLIGSRYEPIKGA